MHILFVRIIILLALPAHMLTAKDPRPDSLKQRSNTTLKTSGTPAYALLNINYLTSWMRYDGHSNHSPSGDDGLPRAQETRTDSTATILSSSWSLERFSQPDIRMQPDRSLTSLLSLVPGITNVNGKLYARGSREGELNYRFGGISVLNRWSNTPGIPFLPEMLTGVTAHTGAYGPSMGAESGGVIDMELRDGGDWWSADATYFSDRFARMGEQFLKTSSFGRTTAVITFGGPLPFESNLFVAAEVAHADNRSPMYLDPMTYDFTQDRFGPRGIAAEGMPFPGPLNIKRNFVPGQSLERKVVQFNIHSPTLGPDFRFFGSVSSEESKDITWSSAVTNIFRLDRVPFIKESVTFLAGEASYPLTESVRLLGQVSYYDRQSGQRDPDFGENWMMFMDSAANARFGYTGFLSRYDGPYDWSAIVGFFFRDPSAPNTTFWKERQRRLSISGKVEAQISPMWNVVLHGESDWWTLRKYTVKSIIGLRILLDRNMDGIDDWAYTSELEKRIRWKQLGAISNFGYSVEGNELNDGFDAPRRPSHYAVDLNNRIVDENVTFELGARAQWVSNDIPYLLAQWDSATGTTTYPLISSLNVIDENYIRSTASELFILPRVSIEYNEGQFRLYAAGGSYVDMTAQDQLQIDNAYLSNLLLDFYRTLYNLGFPPLTYTAKASRTQFTEVGMNWRATDDVSLSLQFHVKQMTDQLRLGFISSDNPSRPYVAWVNSGESISTGMDIGLLLSSQRGISFAIDATISRQIGNGSSPRSNQQEVTDAPIPLPQELFPLEFQRELQLRAKLTFVAPEGSGFEGLQLMAQAFAFSGLPFTKELEDPMIGGGVSSPWTVGVKSFRDVRTRMPVEPYFASRTPWITGIDASVAYEAKLGPVSATFFVLIKNILDTKNALNVYPTTGKAKSDGWLESSTEQVYEQFSGYAEYYDKLNNVNRWAYVQATGNDLFGQPRQLQFGVRVGI